MRTAQTRPGLFSHKQTRPSLRPAVPEPPPASLLPAERLRGGERRPHPVGIGVNSVGRGLWDHRVQPTSEPHHAKYSTALSATSGLPQNTSRLGDSPTPGQRIPSSPWKRPRSPQRAAPWLPESPGRRGRPSPLAGALSPGRRGRGGRAAPAPPWAPPSPLPAPPPACGGAAPPRGPARARGHTRARAARPAGQLAVSGGGHCAAGPRATPGPSGRRPGRGGGARTGALRLRPGAGRVRLRGCGRRRSGVRRRRAAGEGGVRPCPGAAVSRGAWALGRSAPSSGTRVGLGRQAMAPGYPSPSSRETSPQLRPRFLRGDAERAASCGCYEDRGIAAPSPSRGWWNSVKLKLWAWRFESVLPVSVAV